MMPLPPIRPTPILSDHARERCAEMQISTKVAKAIYRHADVIRPGRPAIRDDIPRQIAHSDLYPDYTVVFVETSEGPVIITVLFKTQDFYVRDGATFIPKKKSA